MAANPLLGVQSQTCSPYILHPKHSCPYIVSKCLACFSLQAAFLRPLCTKLAFHPRSLFRKHLTLIIALDSLLLAYQVAFPDLTLVLCLVLGNLTSLLPRLILTWLVWFCPASPTHLSYEPLLISSPMTCTISLIVIDSPLNWHFLRVLENFPTFQ